MTHSENYVIFLESHSPPKKKFECDPPIFLCKILIFLLLNLWNEFRISLCIDFISPICNCSNGYFTQENYLAWSSLYFVMKIFLTSIEQFLQSAKGQDTFWNRMLVSRGFSDLLTNLYLYKTRKVNLVFFRFFFPSAYDYISILPYPPTHLVSKHKHFAKPTHPPFWLRNTWMVPKLPFDVQAAEKMLHVI